MKNMVSLINPEMFTSSHQVNDNLGDDIEDHLRMGRTEVR
jgi:hypothetical protein